MTRTPLSLSCRSLPAAAALLCLTPSLRAADRFFVPPTGGVFGIASNWSATDGGAGGATVPGVSDAANFALGGTYTTTFNAGATTLLLVVPDGTVTFDLNGQTYTVTNNGGTNIGGTSGQTGRLTVKDGTLAPDTSGDDLALGFVAGGTGFLTVSSGGQVGTAALKMDFNIGNNGTGTLTVNDNGRVEAGTVNLGILTGAVGSVTVTGPNAVMNTVDTTIGNNGTGSLNVTGGGTLVNSASVEMGQALGSDGIASVSGVGSSWTMAGAAILGDGGDGTLTISAGGRVTSSSTVVLGNNATGVGTATVTGSGSRWNLANTQTIGASGLGVLTISAGGVVTNANAATLGTSASGEGRATVTGAGSLWTLAAGLTVGSFGAGDLMISAGAEVSASGLGSGDNASASGVITVTGAGSKLTTTGAMGVGGLGSGTLNITSGGEVTAGSVLTVNDGSGAPIGTVNLDGGSLYCASNFQNIGVLNFSDGLLQVKGSFQPSAAAAAFTLNGADNDDLPTLDLLAAAATTNVTSVIVGNNRRGALRLRQGRVFNLAGNSMSLGALTGGDGTATVEGGAQLLAASLSIGGTTSGSGGTGRLTLGSGGVGDAGALRLYTGGTIDLGPGGTLAVDTLPVFDGVFNWTGGTLRFDAAFSLTATNAPKLLGSDATLNAGQALTSAASVNVTLDTPVIVDGGTLSVGNSLNNNSTLEIRSGSATVAGTITNSAGAQLFVARDLSVGAALTNLNGGRIELVGHTGRLLGAGSVSNAGLVTGDGTIATPFTNTATGEVCAEAGARLDFTGTTGANAGRCNLKGGALSFTQPLTNSATGRINGHGVLFVPATPVPTSGAPAAGLNNSGQLNLSGGDSLIFGTVAMNAGSRLIASGGATATFFDIFRHAGTEVKASAGSALVFFGEVRGPGSFTGSGIIYMEGGYSPGASPASVSLAPQMVFTESNTLNMEIGGTTPGTQHDKLTFTHAAAPQVTWGGTLNVTLINAFTPAAGDAFDVFDFDATRDAGTFATLTLPPLPAGLAWDTAQLYTDGTLRVISTTGLTFAQWAAASGIPGALPDGDHDSDGYDNATEFALGLFPPQPGTVEPSGGLHNYAEGERLRVLFTRPLDRTGVTLVVQASDDLLTWTDLATSVNSQPFTGPGFVSENRAHPLSDPGLVEVRDILNTATTPRRQLRLLITLNP